MLQKCQYLVRYIFLLFFCIYYLNNKLEKVELIIIYLIKSSNWQLGIIQLHGVFNLAEKILFVENI